MLGGDGDGEKKRVSLSSRKGREDLKFSKQAQEFEKKKKQDWQKKNWALELELILGISGPTNF